MNFLTSLKYLFGISTSIIILCTNSFASTQKDLSESEQLTKIFVREVRDWIERKGTREVRSANEGVKVVIEDSIMPLIWVQPDRYGNGNTIRMTRQFRLVLSYFAEASVVAFFGKKYLSCQNNYNQYLYEIYRKNGRRAYEGIALVDFNAPEVASLSGGALCKEFAEQFPIRDDLKPMRDNSVTHALLFFYFHELAHIALKHRQPDSSLFLSAQNESIREKAFLEYMKRSRRQESAADRWAVDQLINMKIKPRFLFNDAVFSLMLASSGIDCGAEHINTHPFAVNRIVKIMLRAKYAAERKYKREFPAELKQIISEFKRFHLKSRRLLECK